MELPKRPMLCATGQPTDEDLQRLFDRDQFLIVNPKFDGIRAKVKSGVTWSRKLLPLPNLHLQRTLCHLFGYGPYVDGEVVAYQDGQMLDFNSTQSRVMSVEGEFEFKYHLFDVPDVDDDYQGRAMWITKIFQEQPLLNIVEATYVFNLEQLDSFTDNCIENGYEGIVIRSPRGLYKSGRSTMSQGWMLRRKPMEDEEALIIGFVQRMENLNPAKENALGLQERSSHRINLRPTGELGAFVCWSERWGQFNVSPGNMTKLQRCNVWEHQDEWLRTQITFKYQQNHSKDKPHAAQYKARRHELA